MTFSRFSVVAALFIAAACSKPAKEKSEQQAPEVQAQVEVPDVVKAPVTPALPPGQWYRGTLDFDEVGLMPFYLLLPDGEKGVAYYKNGAELVPAAYSWDGDTVTIEADWAYTSQLRATKTDAGLSGQWTRDTPLWGEVVRAFQGTPVSDPMPGKRFDGAPADFSVAGVWKFEFEHHGDGVGEFTQEGDVVSGFVRPGSLGDLRFLSGNVRDGALKLSTFNGNVANLLDATADSKTMSGQISMQNVWNEKFTATKVESTYRPENGVSFVAKNGKASLPELAEYEGSPTVLVFFATWCPSCIDATPFLIGLEEKYRDKGVRFHSISYDLSEDQAATAQEIEVFKKKYGVPWKVTQRPTTPERWAKDMPKEIQGWDGLPVTVFIGRDGNVQNIYGGWYGPAAPEDNAKLKTRFDTWTAELAAKPI